jgi:hypothetical protein
MIRGGELEKRQEIRKRIYIKSNAYQKEKRGRAGEIK